MTEPPSTSNNNEMMDTTTTTTSIVDGIKKKIKKEDLMIKTEDNITEKSTTGSIVKNDNNSATTTTAATSTSTSIATTAPAPAPAPAPVTTTTTSSSTILFPVGPAGKRELRRALISSKNPVTTIQNFQRTHSLHTMMSKAFTTTPRHEIHNNGNQHNIKSENNHNGNNMIIESFDSDSVMTFLHHLGVRQFDVHKRISDTILKQLEIEIKKTNDTIPLLELLKQCWSYTTTLSELRPILWAVLKQLDTKIPISVLLALAERNTNTTNNNNNNGHHYHKKNNIMKHADIFRPLPSSLKQLVWEADWDHITSKVDQQQQYQQQQQQQQPPPSNVVVDEEQQKLYRTSVESTLFYDTIYPYIIQYLNTDTLISSSNKAYVATITERKLLTSQRRALVKITTIGGIATSASESSSGGNNNATAITAAATTTTTTTAETNTTTNTSSILRQGGGGAGGTNTSNSRNTVHHHNMFNESSRAISHIRYLLCDKVGSSNASSYRPKMLYALLSILIAQHGGAQFQFTNATNKHDHYHNKDDDHHDSSSTALITETSTSPHQHALVGGSHFLHCTLVADILLSAGGPLPKAYTHVLALAQILDECVQEGNVTDANVIKIQACIKQLFQPQSTTIATSTTTNTNTSTNKTTNKHDTNSSSKALGKNTKSSSSSGNEKKLKDNNLSNNALTIEEQRQLNKFIRNGLEQMEKADTQNLFLNPVTDDIAPGYSSVIKNPMCINTMENKVLDSIYINIQEWENDVKLMFQNCVTYNQGDAGQWFRNEAIRQHKVFKEKIVSKLRTKYSILIERNHKDRQLKLQQQQLKSKTSSTSTTTTTTSNKSNSTSNTFDKKRKFTDTNHDNNGSNMTSTNTATDVNNNMIEPLLPSNKKRKKEKEDFIPSVVCLASMLLADPFVVRIFVARILRDLRVHVMGGTSLPCSHTVLPSLLQILHITNMSQHICSIWGRKFVVPHSGLLFQIISSETNNDKLSPTDITPYVTLRRIIPILLRLTVEAEYDKRISIKGGDLYAASQTTPMKLPALIPSHDMIPTSILANHSNNIRMDVPVSLIKGALIQLCQPGNRNEGSLHITYNKFATVLTFVSTITSLDGMVLLNDKVFFHCLITALLRHKTKITKETRDVVIDSWLKWLCINQKKKQQQQHDDDDADNENNDNNNTTNDTAVMGSMTSAAHECLIYLLNEWNTLSNAVLPRDKLLLFCMRAINATNQSEQHYNKYRRFQFLWEAAVSATTDDNINNNDENIDEKQQLKKKKREKKMKQEDINAFIPIMKQYKRMLKNVPESNIQQWTEQTGLSQ